MKIDQHGFSACKISWGVFNKKSGMQSSATLLYDVPLIAHGNVNHTNLILSNYSFYFKGQVGKLDYRFILTKSFMSLIDEPLQHIAVTNKLAVNPNISGYVKWKFWDKESNPVPLAIGIYFGKKKALVLGIGGKTLADPMIMYDVGLSLLFKDYPSKLVLNAQNRLVYMYPDNELKVSSKNLCMYLSISSA